MDSSLPDINTGKGEPRKIIAAISVVLCSAVAFLILGPRPEGMDGALDVSFFPIINASLNGVTILLLLAALAFIKQQKIELHRNTVLAAMTSSALFLVSYVIYHWFKPGPMPYEGAYPWLYYPVLISHIILAIVIVPLVLTTFFRGWTMDRERHRKIAKITFPLWLYVSVTGIVVFFMLS